MDLYRKHKLQSMIPWNTEMSMEHVSVSEADTANGSPQQGDMIAVNPEDRTDMWLVAEKFFKENYVKYVPDFTAEMQTLGIRRATVEIERLEFDLMRDTAEYRRERSVQVEPEKV